VWFNHHVKKFILTCFQGLPVLFMLLTMLCGCIDEALPAKEVSKKNEPTPDELIESAKSGDASVMVEILTRIEGGESFPIDQEAVFTMLKQAAANEDAEAQFHLGIILVYGSYSIPKNIEQGIEFLKKAAESGNQNALYNLGNIHFLGLDGRFRNTKFALDYYKQAAANEKQNLEIVSLVHRVCCSCQL
jgi:TPR repeat protein